MCYVYYLLFLFFLPFLNSLGRAVWGLLARGQGYKKDGLSRTYLCFNLQMYNKMRRLQRSFCKMLLLSRIFFVTLR
jgi:hypothetical protein